MVNEPPLSPAQVRAARAWLSWSQEDLSIRSGVSHTSIARFESERSVPYDGTLTNIRNALEAAGINFRFAGALGTGISGPAFRQPKPTKPSR
ncbi:helix-turn-helix transcriptional regulator [Bradyrhizobium algeriense]|uniref:helix-turn-helix domain-containing protein n=1 Tax=Bradyrhizobium algeriense TaxID=634784 RepID=UPI002FF0377E